MVLAMELIGSFLLIHLMQEPLSFCTKLYLFLVYKFLTDFDMSSSFRSFLPEFEMSGCIWL